MKNAPRVLRLLFFAAILCVPPRWAAAEGWTQWRGPSRDGRLAAATGPWASLASLEPLKQQWSIPLGPSYSGPIVDQKRVYVTETVNKQREVVSAVDRCTGKVVWKTGWDGAMKVPFFAARNGSWIRATPALDDGRLYVAGMRDVLVCLEADTGKTMWRVDFVQRLKSPLPAFGFVSSPLIHGDSVYVQAGAGLVKLEKHTGEIVWTSLRDGGGMNGSAFSSPVWAKLHGVPQLVVQTRTYLAGVRPGDGEVLWKIEVPAFRGMNILTPTVIGNRIFTSAYGGRSMMLAVSRQDGQWSVSPIWEQKSQGYMSSPIVHHGAIYLHLRNRRVTCLNVADGKETWTTTPFGQYWSMIGIGDRIMSLDQNGELLLIHASPSKFDLLDRKKVADDSWAHLAIADDELFVRSLTALRSYKCQAKVQP